MPKDDNQDFNKPSFEDDQTEFDNQDIPEEGQSFEADNAENNVEPEVDKERESSRKPWSSRFGEDENLKNRQYSRTSRNQPAKEATTLSKVLLLLFVILLIIPFAIFMVVDAQRSNDNIPDRTTEQVNISRSSVSQESSSAESSSESEDESESSSEESESISSQEITSSAPPETPVEPEVPVESTVPQPQPEPEPVPETGTGTHTVAAGETWYGIARSYGTDVYTLVGMNNATIDTPIVPGMVITVP